MNNDLNTENQSKGGRQTAAGTESRISVIMHNILSCPRRFRLLLSGIAFRYPVRALLFVLLVACNKDEETVVNKPGLDAQAFSVAENIADDFAIATVTATAQAGAALAYSITANTADGLFEIGGSSGELSLATGKALDFETATSHAITVQVSDKGTPPQTADAKVTIAVTDVNEVPVFSETSYAFVAAESSGATDVIGTVVATDPDADATLAYSITTNATGDLFEVGGSNGEISLATGKMLAIASPSHDLTLQVSDGTLTADVAVTITVADMTTIVDQTFTVAENIGDDFTIGTVSAVGRTGTSLTYSITANTDDLFEIDGNSGALSLAAGKALNFETAIGHAITVQVSDDGTPPQTADAMVTIVVTNVNEAPAFSATSYAFVAAESSEVTDIIGTVSATDPEGGTVTYSITMNAVGDLFEVGVSNGEISLATGKMLAIASPSHDLTLQVSDGTLTADVAVTITVTDMTTIVDQAFSTEENIGVDVTIGTVSAAGRAGTSLTYSITANTADGLFEIDGSSGELSLVAGKALDFEATTTSYTITVRVSDNGTPPQTADAEVTIAVTNVNEAPVFGATSYAFTVAESIVEANVIGTVTAEDPESGTVTYSITANVVGDLFEIDGSSGALSLAAGKALSFEAAASHTITVRASDNVTPPKTADADVTIAVTDVNEAPAFGVTSYMFTVADDIGEADVIGTVSATDPESASLTYSITTNAVGDLFEVGASNGEISLATGKMLAAASPSHNLTLQVSDGALTDDVTVTITVTATNGPPVFGAASYAFSSQENIAEYRCHRHGQCHRSRRRHRDLLHHGKRRG